MSEDLKILAEDVVDFSDAVEAACVKLRMNVEKMLGAEVKRKRSWDPAKIKWAQTEGSKGLYERSEDVDNLDFKAMVKNLAEHGGRGNYEGYFYWVFQNGASVGRKKTAVKT